MQDLKLKACTFTKELEAFTSHINELVEDNAQLASQNKDLAAPSNKTCTQRTNGANHI
jgi:regulator of replication initiation timing